MKHFEDYEVGRLLEHGAYEVRAKGIMAFARQYDSQPFHPDMAAAASSVFGGLTASGFHTVASTTRQGEL